MNTNPRPTPGQLQADHLQNLHRQLVAEIEVLHEKEAHLKDYEARLRSFADQHPAASRTPFQGVPVAASTAELAAAWEKFHRSQALLEAERRAFNDERLLLRVEAAALKNRTAAITRREVWIDVCEKEIAAIASTTVAAAPTAPPRRSFTSVPFAAMKQIFSRAG